MKDNGDAWPVSADHGRPGLLGSTQPQQNLPRSVDITLRERAEEVPYPAPDPVQYYARTIILCLTIETSYLDVETPRPWRQSDPLGASRGRSRPDERTCIEELTDARHVPQQQQKQQQQLSCSYLIRAAAIRLEAKRPGDVMPKQRDLSMSPV